MSWLKRPHRPLRLPADAFVEIEPIEENGQKLRRFKLKGVNTGDAVLTEVRGELIEIGEVEVKPMQRPAGGVFFEEYAYDDPKDDR